MEVKSIAECSNIHSQKDPKFVFKIKYCLMEAKEDRKFVFKTNNRLMQVKGSILQYFRPSLSYHLSLRSLFCLFLSGRFTQVLLYNTLWIDTSSKEPFCLKVLNSSKWQFVEWAHRRKKALPNYSIESKQWLIFKISWEVRTLTSSGSRFVCCDLVYIIWLLKC